jgi:signal transduction histidine kinase
MLNKIISLLFLFYVGLFGLDMKQNAVSLSKQCSIFKTNTYIVNPLQIDDTQFVQNTKGIENFGYSRNFYWLKCTLKNDTNITSNKIFELGFTPMDYVDFYEFDTNKTLKHHFKSGDLREISERIIRNKNHIFPITFAPNEIKTIYLQVQNSGAVTIDCKLYDRFYYFSEVHSNKNAFIVSFLTLIVFLMLYNLILFISLKDISFIYYFLAMASMLVYQSTLFGVAYEYCSFIGLWNLTLLVNISGALFTAFSVLFVSSYFELQKHSLKLYKINRNVIVGFYSFALSLLILNISYSQIASLLPLFGMIMIFWILALAIIGHKKSRINTRYIFIGWGISGVLMSIYVLQIMGIIETKIIDDLSIRIGTLIEMVFFSFALGDKLRFLKDEISQAKIKALEYEKQLLVNSRLAIAGETVGNIAHQWRQPLNRLGMILVKLRLKKEVEPEELLQSLKDSEKILEDMSQTIDLFLNFFAQDNKKEPFLLHDCVASAVEIIHESFTQNNIKLNIHNIKNIKLLGSSNELAQVILNLLSNAKYILLARNIQNPTITLEIKKTNDNIVISIEDNGGGIKISPIEKVFDPYISTKENKNGVGLGLYIARKIIDKYSGELFANNTDDGATFSIILPLANEG